MPEFSVINDNATSMPYTCDFKIDSAAKFIKQGLSLQNNQSPKVVSLVADVTFDETHQKLKNLRLGFAGTHVVPGDGLRVP